MNFAPRHCAPAAPYGVVLPDADGKAGIAALVVDPSFDLAALHAPLVERLPSCARALFVRLCPALETTGTFRLRRTDLAREGYAASSDPVWQEKEGAFVPYAAARPVK